MGTCLPFQCCIPDCHTALCHVYNTCPYTLQAHSAEMVTCCLKIEASSGAEKKALFSRAEPRSELYAPEWCDLNPDANLKPKNRAASSVKILVILKISSVISFFYYLVVLFLWQG